MKIVCIKKVSLKRHGKMTGNIVCKKTHLKRLPNDNKNAFEKMVE